jgi:hypothetical protein
MYNNKCNFILTGDYNARVGERLDYVEESYHILHVFLPEDYI